MDQFFPVGNCLALSTAAQGGPLALTNGAPSGLRVCVEGVAEPFAQPPPVTYVVEAQLGPAAADCPPGEQKTFTVRGGDPRVCCMRRLLRARPAFDAAAAAPLLAAPSNARHLRAVAPQITNTATGTPLGGAGAIVTAAAEPPATITLTCPPAAAQQAVNLAQAQGAPDLAVSIGGFQTYVAVEHAWSITKTVAADGGGENVTALELPLGANELPRTVRYTVRVERGPPRDARFYVAGTITVANGGGAPADLAGVFVTAGGASVAAACPGSGGGGGGGVSVAPGAPLVCAFNVTWNRAGAGGSLGARVEAAGGGGAEFTADPAPFDFDRAERGPPRGATAKVFDDITGAPPNGTLPPPAAWWGHDGEAGEVLPASDAGVTLTAAGSREYTYEVRVGPFVTDTACGTYTLGNEASVVPDGAPASAAARARADVAVAVSGCRGGVGLASLGGAAGADVEGVKTARVTGSAWTVATAATPASVQVRLPCFSGLLPPPVLCRRSVGFAVRAGRQRAGRSRSRPTPHARPARAPPTHAGPLRRVSHGNLHRQVCQGAHHQARGLRQRARVQRAAGEARRCRARRGGGGGRRRRAADGGGGVRRRRRGALHGRARAGPRALWGALHACSLIKAAGGMQATCVCAVRVLTPPPPAWRRPARAAGRWREPHVHLHGHPRRRGPRRGARRRDGRRRRQVGERARAFQL